MQLPRVVIAAVFFVIGALLLVPMLVDAVSSDSSASASATTSPSATPSGSPTGGTASPSPTTSKPTSSPTASQPAQPVTATIGSVSCPASTVNVKLRNTGKQSEDFGIEKNDDSASIPGELRPNSTRTVAVELREDRSTRITVNWANKRIESKTVKANCDKAGAAPTKPPEKLPHTGPDAVLWARAATGVAIILTGAIIFWYGGIWPRRRDQIFPKKSG